MLAQLHDDVEDEPMLPLAQMGLILVDWLDPQKAVYVACPRPNRCDTGADRIQCQGWNRDGSHVTFRSGRRSP